MPYWIPKISGEKRTISLYHFTFRQCLAVRICLSLSNLPSVLQRFLAMWTLRCVLVDFFLANRAMDFLLFQPFAAMFTLLRPCENLLSAIRAFLCFFHSDMCLMISNPVESHPFSAVSGAAELPSDILRVRRTRVIPKNPLALPAARHLLLQVSGGAGGQRPQSQRHQSPIKQVLFHSVTFTFAYIHGFRHTGCYIQKEKGTAHIFSYLP